MIPYETVGMAEAALGRNLTKLEHVWFKYTANVSDYKIYCMNAVFLFVIFNLAPLPSVILDLLKAKSFEKYRLQPGVHNSKSAIFECYKKVMLVFLTVVVPFQLSSYPAVKMVGIYSDLPLPSLRTMLIQLTVYYLVEDYGNYWIHRWLHSEWAFDNIHFMHHEFQAPNSFAAPYAHPAEIFLLGIPTFVGPALVPGHMVTFMIWIALRQLEAIETHSGYDFPWSPTKLIPFYGGPEYHDYHHFVGGDSQSNFASVFTFCDRLYGTDKVVTEECDPGDELQSGKLFLLPDLVGNVQGYRYQQSFLRKAREEKVVTDENDWVILDLPTEKKLRTKSKAA